MEAIELSRLNELEDTIQRGLETFVEVGQALMEIRDRRLYKTNYGTFEDYCQNRWGWGRNYVNKQIRAAEVVNILGTIVPIQSTESQLRPLSPLEPEQQREAWQRAQEIAGERPLVARDVQRAVDELQFYETTNASQPVAVTVFSSESNEYYTPVKYIEAARELMGGIDVDPASCEAAQRTIKADSYYTEDDDGLSKGWSGRVWLNPPYGKIGNESSQGYWGQQLLSRFKTGEVSEGVLLVRAGVGYEWFEKLWDVLPVCFVRERLSFIREDGNDDGQSKQGTALFYIGNNVKGFIDIFHKFGRIILPENQL